MCRKFHFPIKSLIKVLLTAVVLSLVSYARGLALQSKLIIALVVNVPLQGAAGSVKKLQYDLP